MYLDRVNTTDLRFLNSQWRLKNPIIMYTRPVAPWELFPVNIFIDIGNSYRTIKLPRKSVKLSVHSKLTQMTFTCLKPAMEKTVQCVCETYSRVTIKTVKCRHDVIMVSFLLTLNRFYTKFWCFHFWLWTNKCQLGTEQKVLGNLPSSCSIPSCKYW